MQEQQGELTFGNCGLDDTINDMRTTMQRFAAAKVTPHAHRWHLENSYVPMEIIEELSELGVFALTLPEDFGGLGLPKEAMCVVSEELSRGWIAVGSLGTRAEIACELILCGGTRRTENQMAAQNSQREKFFPPPFSPNPIRAPISVHSRPAP